MPSPLFALLCPTEFGVNDLIEIFFGHSVVSDLTCIGIGLVVVFGVKVSKRPLLRLDRWS